MRLQMTHPIKRDFQFFGMTYDVQLCGVMCDNTDMIARLEERCMKDNGR